MVNTENILRQTLDRIAKEYEYVDYNMHLKPINTDGANYTSQLYDVTLSAAGKDDLNLFAKVANVGLEFRAKLSLQIFEFESLFYTKLVTVYRRLEQKYNLPAEDRLILPKYYGGSTEYMKETLVLANLTKNGFRTFDRFQYINWEYTAKCVEKLARLHALSVCYERDEPGEFRTIMEKVKSNMPIAALKEYVSKTAAQALEVTDEAYKKRLERFLEEQLQEDVLNRYHNPERQVALIHGDFRPSNILHRINENGKLEVVLVDYQLLQKSNPLMDLIFFLVCGSDEEFRAKYFNQYFDYYYAEFSKSLLKLKINPEEVYTKQDFDEDIKKFLPSAIIFGVSALPIVTVDMDNAPKPEDRMELASFGKPSALFRTRFNALLKDFADMGVL